jgi:hypothetical protein
VLCIECGYDRRTGRKRATVHRAGEEEPEAEVPPRKKKGRREPLPAVMARVQVGLRCHSARLVWELLALLVMLGLLCYAGIARARPGDRVLDAGGLTAFGIALLAILLGVLGSTLCLWVGRASRARRYIVPCLVLGLLTLPLCVSVQIGALPPQVGLLIGWVLGFASWLCFMRFLRRLALYLELSDDANEISALILRGTLLLVAVPLLLVLLGMWAYLQAALGDRRTASVLEGVSALIIFVQLLFVISLYFSILGNIHILRTAITSRLAQQDRRKEEMAPVPPGGE